MNVNTIFNNFKAHIQQRQPLAPGLTKILRQIEKDYDPASRAVNLQGFGAKKLVLAIICEALSDRPNPSIFRDHIASDAHRLLICLALDLDMKSPAIHNDFSDALKIDLLVNASTYHIATLSRC